MKATPNPNVYGENHPEGDGHPEKDVRDEFAPEQVDALTLAKEKLEQEKNEGNTLQ